jgi:hypothetical protein
MRPPIPANYRAAIRCPMANYADLLLPAGLQALWWMCAKPAVAAIDRFRVSVIARVAQDRYAAGFRYARFKTEQLRSNTSVAPHLPRSAWPDGRA